MPDLRSFHFKEWSDVYEKNLTRGVRAAFEEAEKAFNDKHKTTYYSSFESFKSARTNRRNAAKKNNG